MTHLVDRITFYYWTWNHNHSEAEGCKTLCGKGFAEVATEEGLKYTVPIRPAEFPTEDIPDICPACLAAKAVTD
jgi:hypothetical protein